VIISRCQSVASMRELLWDDGGWRVTQWHPGEHGRWSSSAAELRQREKPKKWSSRIQSIIRHAIRFLPTPMSMSIRGRTTESKYCSENGATILYRINFSEYATRVTIFSWMLITACCLLVRLSSSFFIKPEAAQDKTYIYTSNQVKTVHTHTLTQAWGED